MLPMHFDIRILLNMSIDYFSKFVQAQTNRSIWIVEDNNVFKTSKISPVDFAPTGAGGSKTHDMDVV